MTSSDSSDTQLYQITYLGAGDPDTRTVGSGEVAGIIEEAGQRGRKVRIRPHRHPQHGGPDAGKGEQS
ncbi:hypothetical protein MTF65_03135 [Streptomyces sp. APSN-46.1]|uniref:hypothetical protein n=1 Tax=Streptomyces sp. APSN-46.1 TaxID=2929049 RepID=UPI001FB4CFB3|nr:hypothetical protein [Streptomyces sp. APSN-46.1]MCJ1676361.1 hypothetical protein [Streptomyces sp. APSN-46.1]